MNPLFYTSVCSYIRCVNLTTDIVRRNIHWLDIKMMLYAVSSMFQCKYFNGTCTYIVYEEEVRNLCHLPKEKPRCNHLTISLPLLSTY